MKKISCAERIFRSAQDLYEKKSRRRIKSCGGLYEVTTV